MSRRWMRGSLILLLILLPVAGYQAYRSFGTLPAHITLATGAEGGRYHGLGRALAQALRTRHGVEVELLPSRGTLDNLRLVQSRAADLALAQQGLADVLAHLGATAPAPPATDALAFVANLDTEATLIVSPAELAVDDPARLAGLRVSLGSPGTADHAVGLWLLERAGLGVGDLSPVDLPYDALATAFAEGRLDAALITMGPLAPVLDELLSTGTLVARGVSHGRALRARVPVLTETRLAAGLFALHPAPLPAEALETIGFRAQLVTHRDSHVGLIEAVTEVVLDPAFARRHGLGELFDGGAAFARAEPAFAMHPGAAHIYEPGLQPFLDPDFVEATEGLRSFVVSMGVAGLLLVRWILRRHTRAREHALDRYIHALLDIERRQVDLDARMDAEQEATLERLLDEVTWLRQDALGSFSAHELAEDRGSECFVSMCHALSDKIAGKLLRHRVDQLRGALEALATTSPDAV